MRRRHPLFPASAATIGLILAALAAPAAAHAAPVSAVDFEDGTMGTWTASGPPALAVIDDPTGGPGKVLSVSGRTEGWHTVQSATGLFDEGEEYTLSARVNTAVAGQARFIVKDGYHWVGNTDTAAGAWTTVSGTFTADADDTQVYIEVAPGTSDFLLDDVVIEQAGGGGENPQEPGTVLIDGTFDDGELGGWSPRAGSDTSAPATTVVAGGAADTAFAAEVSNRTHEGDGIQLDVAGTLLAGQTYALSAAVRFAPGSDAGQGLTVSMRTVTGGSTSYTNLLQIENATAADWTTVEGQFTVPAYDTAAELYIEARYNSGNTSTFLVDQVRVWVPEPEVVDTSLTPLKDSVDFPLGVAIDSRETTGSASQLLLHHFDQITPENHMKVEAWYDADKQFTRHAQATALLDYARDNGLRLYGHVLVWHSQTPDWFFQDDTGRELTSSEADKQFLRERLWTHIDDVAKSIADDYGPYGSATNPLVAWDVVNEVISDQSTADGLRTSRWYQVLGEEYIHLAFRYADEAFNDRYAAAGTDRPVTLFINDYNTEQDVKGAQYEALVKRLLAADVPIDGVGHQFHVSVNTSIASLDAALDRFAGLGLLQEVTELDVTINPATDATRIRQGHFYRDAFEVFRNYHAAAPVDEKLFAATVWGLTDNRSWRSEQQPLLFDAALQAKPAYFGAVGDDDGLPPLVTTANVFQGDVAIATGFADDIAWRNLPENPLTGGAGGFQLRWNADHLTALVRTTVAPERIEFTYDGADFVYTPGGASGTPAGAVPGATVTVGGERFSVVHLPHTDAARGDTAAFDVRVVSGGSVAGAWNSPGATGQLTFLEPLSSLEIPQLAAPTVDAVVDPVWTQAATATTATRVEGDAAGATAQVRTLWQGNILYTLFEVTDPVADNTNSDPWNQDSVELFLDLGNRKSGSYGPNDTQIRITADGSLSFGTGDAARQQARVTAHATAKTATGYIVEAAIALVGESGGQSDVPLGGLGTFHGIDFQVNDGRDGSRFSVHTWAEPTGTGYQNTARWGVARLAPAPAGPEEPGTLVKTPKPTIAGAAQVGRTLTAKAGTWDAGVRLAYQWKADGVAIPGATKATLTLTAAHRGARVTVTVTGSKDGFTSVSRTSARTAKVAAGVLSKAPRPAVAGAAKVGRTLTAHTGTWDRGVKLAYQWKADGRKIAGATKRTLTLSAAQYGDRITVTVTGTKPGYATVAVTSKPTAKVAAGSLGKRPTPAISGTAKVGSTLTVKPGSWDRGVKLSYQWYADGSAIKGATKATLRLTSAERGDRITVRVTAKKSGYAPVIRVSKATPPVRR